MAAVDLKTLKLGDILITAASNTVSHCGMIAGTTSINAASGRVDRPNIVYHATSTKGVTNDDVGTWKGGTGVFRCKSLRFITHGGVSAEKKIADAAVALASRCSYGKGRALFKSWTGTSDYGSSAKGRVAKYLLRLGADGPFVTTLYCSEYVVLAYQIAAKGDETVPYFIGLDGKHTLPKDLRNWILQRTTPGGSWEYVGDLG